MGEGEGRESEKEGARERRERRRRDGGREKELASKQNINPISTQTNLPILFMSRTPGRF